MHTPQLWPTTQHFRTLPQKHCWADHLSPRAGRAADWNHPSSTCTWRNTFRHTKITSRYTEHVQNACSEHAQHIQHFPKSSRVTVDKQTLLNLVSWFMVSWKADYLSGKTGQKRQLIDPATNMALTSYFMTPSLPWRDFGKIYLSLYPIIPVYTICQCTTLSQTYMSTEITFILEKLHRIQEGHTFGEFIRTRTITSFIRNSSAHTKEYRRQTQLFCACKVSWRQ